MFSPTWMICASMMTWWSQLLQCVAFDNKHERASGIRNLPLATIPCNGGGSFSWNEETKQCLHNQVMVFYTFFFPGRKKEGVRDGWRNFPSSSSQQGFQLLCPFIVLAKSILFRFWSITECALSFSHVSLGDYTDKSKPSEKAQLLFHFSFYLKQKASKSWNPFQLSFPKAASLPTILLMPASSLLVLLVWVFKCSTLVSD